ncbi:MAG: NnrS family protein, partial [Hydrogenophaga sp.]|nr:NnrS family protein [Hydrogenophaga sp.]
MNPAPMLTAKVSAPVSQPLGWPLLRLGFRPFYLGAAAYGMLAIPLWIALLLGQVSLSLTVPPVLWHAHEMLFGFTVAVIVGFLLTAGKAWTGLDTPRGIVLAGLVGLWLVARIAALIAPYVVY